LRGASTDSVERLLQRAADQVVALRPGAATG
jgi:hypothetical protein